MNARQEYLNRELTMKETNRILVILWQNAKARCVTRVAKYMLLNSPFQYQGQLIEVEAKSVGAGVYELSRKQE